MDICVLPETCISMFRKMLNFETTVNTPRLFFFNFRKTANKEEAECCRSLRSIANVMNFILKKCPT